MAILNNADLIKRFYESFSRGETNEMVSCYHPDIVFQDPAFGELKGKNAGDMWRMLIARSKGELKITFNDVKADDTSGTANWTAEYIFSQTERKVINKISARFEFKDGKIIKHTDHFDLWNWARQALGWKGYLLGWSSFLKNKIQKQANHLLKSYTSADTHVYGNKTL